MNDTPKTNAAALPTMGASPHVVPIDFARQLERENARLRGALLRTHGSLGLIIKGASAHAPGHRANYEHGGKVLNETC